jgi:hypothetical protein
MLAIDNFKSRRRQPAESFSRDKLRDSIIAVCLSVHTPESQAETTADIVCDAVVDWLSHNPEVTSCDIRQVAAHHLRTYHPEAAYLYEQYRITI